MNIGIRADGGPQIGMGHIMRCLSLAREFRVANHQVVFISNDPVGREKLIENDFKVLAADGDSGTEILTAIIRKNKLDCLIVDSYQVDRDYLLCLKKVAPLLCYIDDLNYFTYPVDILINGNFAAETMQYRKFNSDEQLLLGIKYNLIRSEFRDLKVADVKRQIERVLITMGAADPVNFSARLIRGIRQDKSFDQIQLDVVVGGSNPFKDDLLKLSREYPKIQLHHNVQQMAELMLQTDLAISAGGSSLYELCACGVPTLAVIIAANQESLVCKLSKAGYLKSLGWYNRCDLNELGQIILDLGFEERKIMASKGRELVDARGAERVRDAIISRKLKVKG